MQWQWKLKETIVPTINWIYKFIFSTKKSMNVLMRIGITPLKVYMDEITSLLERQEFCSAQLRFGGTLLTGVIIGLVVSSIIFLRH